MSRLTYRQADGSPATEYENHILIERLAAFEDMYEALCDRRDHLIQDLDALRAQDRTKTVTFKQLLAEKMALTTMIQRIDFYVKPLK